jgi:hypothetical protein
MKFHKCSDAAVGSNQQKKLHSQASNFSNKSSFEI